MARTVKPEAKGSLELNLKIIFWRSQFCFHSVWLAFCLLINLSNESNCLAQSTTTPKATGESDQHRKNQHRPNVIVILTDDQGWGDLSCHGNTNLTTHNLDQLSRSGARFDRFYVCSVCSPTRAEFLTGRYYPRTGVSGVSVGRERLNLGERTIAQDFKAAGYATACFGKWHNGSQYPYHPIARGFDEFYGFCSGHWGDYFSPPMDHNGKPVRGSGYIVDDLTNHALRFIESHALGEFFIFLSLPTPHSPMQVPDQFWQRFKDRPLTLTGPAGKEEDAAVTRATLAMVENIDENVGRVLSKLDELRISQNTIVVFFSDNGPNSDRWNGGMRGRKGSVDEGGVRSPLFIRWPGKISANRLITQICEVTDLYPTLTELADIPIVPHRPIDGVSLAPLLTGKKSSLPDRVICSHWNGQTSIRTQQYRLDAKDRLYDMVADPGQLRDLSSNYPDLRNELREMRERWIRDVCSPAPESDNRPFTVGHPDFNYTELLACDGIPHGSVHRSAVDANTSYFTGWTSTADSVAWHVEVLVNGTFEVDLYYACPEAFVGSEIQLQFQDSSIRRKIDIANDAAARGAENDRVPRTIESYVKDFKLLRLGRMELSRGIGQLELTVTDLKNESIATDISSASEGLEISMLTLRRVR